MTPPSRSMPPTADSKVSIWAWPIVISFGAGYAYLFLRHPAGRWIFGVAVLVVAVVSIVVHRRFKRLKEERKEESICTFARALPARNHDTWVVRAVYEELTSIVQVPLRPTDRLDQDLEIDAGDLEDAALEIARRAGRSLDDTKRNPMRGQVKTVADVVLFFENQRRATSQPVQTAAMTHPPSATKPAPLSDF